MAAVDDLSKYQFVLSSQNEPYGEKVPRYAVQPRIDATRTVKVFHNGEQIGYAGVNRFRDDIGLIDDAVAEGAYEGMKAPKYGYGEVFVSPEHRGKGLGAELWRRLAKWMPNDSIRHHNFQSQEGLALAQKMAEENPRQHILLDGDDELMEGSF